MKSKIKASTLVIIGLLSVALVAVGCSDDPPPPGGTAGSGGMAGNGGDGGMGGGGTGGTGGTVDISCDEGRCQDAQVAMECEQRVLACIAAEPANEEQCIVAGNLIFCSEGTGGTGGSGGSGGMAGGGGTGGGGDPGDIFCDQGLCLEDEDLQASCETEVALCIAETANEEECIAAGLFLFCGGTNAICDTGLCVSEPDREQSCRELVAYCIAEEPQTNWEVCFVFARGFICGEDGGTGGTGGTAGGGGTGGAPDPNELCDEGQCVDPGEKQDACRALVTYCIAEEPEGTWDECFEFAAIFICEVQDQ